MEAMDAVLATGAGRALLGCDWGRKIGLVGDMDRCPDQATKRIMVHNGDAAELLQFCPKHASRVTEETTPH